MIQTKVIYNVKVEVIVPCSTPEAAPSFIERIGEETIKDILDNKDCKILYIESESQTKENTNKHIIILNHDISYYFDDDSKIEIGDCESEHIIYSINQGYSEGELNKSDKNGSDGIRGWWQIVK